MGSVQAQGAGPAADGVAAAHRALLADPSIQFAMTPVPPKPEPPAWFQHLLEWLGNAVRPLGRLLRRLLARLPDWPYAKILLWSVVGCLALLLLWVVIDRVLNGAWRWPTVRRGRSRAAAADDAEAAWQPEAAPLREWLAEADALAAIGRYAEAIRHLLFRAVEDIGRRRPRAVRPALTSRELASTAAIPPAVRTLFARIARLVERSLFGGRPVDADDWQAARAAYADLAQSRNWRDG